jgi:hypothetical protein
MIRKASLTAAALCWLDVSMLGGSISYQVTLNAGACHEVHLGKFTLPEETGPVMEGPTFGRCEMAVRSGGESELFFGVACHGRAGSMPFAPEKYAADPSHPGKARRIDETTWQSAPVLPRSTKGGPPDRREPGYWYQGHLLERSGPSWYGEGTPELIDTRWSWSMNRAAIHSWNGINETHSILDPTSFGRNHVKGHFWIDMYDVATAEPLIRIRGSFNGPVPSAFMGQAVFYSDRYYVIPAGRNTADGEFRMQHLLICDLDAAAKKDNRGLRQRK